MKYIPGIVISLFVIVFGVYNYRIHLQPNYMVLILLYFLIIILTNVMLVQKNIRNIIVRSLKHRTRYEILFLVLSGLYAVLAGLTGFVFPKIEGFPGTGVLNYFVFFLSAFSLSCFNVYAYISGLRKKSGEISAVPADSGTG